MGKTGSAIARNMIQARHRLKVQGLGEYSRKSLPTWPNHMCRATTIRTTLMMAEYESSSPHGLLCVEVRNQRATGKNAQPGKVLVSLLMMSEVLW